jgi:hypothetical protein
MSLDSRGQARQKLVRRTGLGAGGLVLLTLLLFFSGHWLLGIVFGIPAVVMVWVFFQARAVR